MSFADNALGHAAPQSVSRGVELPRRQSYHPSPHDWRDEIIYFLLVDRFSDGKERTRALVDRENPAAGRPNLPDGSAWRWDRWAESGADRWQGGTMRGVASKIGYLKKLGVTTIWLSPVFKQRGHLDSYHGYGVQNFLDVDSRFGKRKDLVDLTAKAHKEGMRVILDIIFNHSGPNWRYPPDTPGGADTPFYTAARYPFGSWVGDRGQRVPRAQGDEDGVWPSELQNVEGYTRAGSGSLGGGDIDDPNAEHKRTDFITLRDFRLSEEPGLLTALARCYKYWIALTDCDGFRLDTLKHVSLEEARNFCGSIKEFAAQLGKHNFFLVGEIAGGDYGQDRYLDVLERNLDAALDIGEMRLALRGVAKGLIHPRVYFDGFDPGNAVMGSHRNIGNRHVSIMDDHDHVFGEKIRFASEASSAHQVAAAVALQFFTLGVPCIYYGTEQSLGGPEPAERSWLPEWKGSDRYLREAMFGPAHPRKSGRDGLARADFLDKKLPGFGPFGTAGRHCFDEKSPAWARIAALAALRKEFPVLRYGRQYLRPFSFLGLPFDFYGPGEIVAWSRILDDEEAVCVLNAHGAEPRGADILVDASLNPPGASLTVVLNSLQAAKPQGFTGANPVGGKLPVRRNSSGAAYVEIRGVQPSETVVLSNHPEKSEGETAR
jgi:glycosidase